MSFLVRYRPFVSVSVQEHGTEKALTGFSLAPTRACARALGDHRLVFRPRANGFRLFYEINPLASDPLMGRIRDRTRFSFALRLFDRSFFDAYEPDLTDDTGPQLYLDNLTPSGNIQAKDTLTTGTFVRTDDAARVRPPVFHERIDTSGAGAPTELRVKDRFDPAVTVLTASVDDSSGDRALTRIDLRARPPGVYSIGTDAAGATARTIYVDQELARTRALGVVDLYWETAQDTAPEDGVPYFIRFRKR